MDTPNSKRKQLEERLIVFAVAIIRLSQNLPRTPKGRHICAHLLRSGTAAAPKYAGARGAESRADFTQTLKVVLKELSETTVWLEIIARDSMVPAARISEVISESRELCRIIALSICTGANSRRLT
jgi:four helix bundle protein